MQLPEATVAYPAHPSFNANACTRFSSTAFLAARLLSDWVIQLSISFQKASVSIKRKSSSVLGLSCTLRSPKDRGSPA